MIEKRLKEAEKLGYKICIIPESNKKLLKENFKLDIIGVKNIKDAMKFIGIIASTVSSFKNIPIESNTVVLGEVGLTGEIRSVNLIEKRIKEAEKLGFKKCIIPESNKKLLKENYKLDIIGVKNVNQVMSVLFNNKTN